MTTTGMTIRIIHIDRTWAGTLRHPEMRDERLLAGDGKRALNTIFAATLAAAGPEHGFSVRCRRVIVGVLSSREAIRNFTNVGTFLENDLATDTRSPTATAATDSDHLTIGSHTLSSRLIVGTGKYDSFDMMRSALDVSGTDCITVAIRRERLYDSSGRNILDFIDLDRYTLLPNTAGCFTAKDALRTARLGREILLGLENPGADWVKLEVLGDHRTLLPDPSATLEATETLVAEGFHVLCYTNDDPVMAKRLKEAGAASVMPAGSPIGSGQGILNPNNIRICLEYLKEGDPNYPVILDAGVGTASDVTIAMELGADGVLLNTGIAHARDPIAMAKAMKAAIEAGHLAHRAGRIPKRLYASASSPEEGILGGTTYESRPRKTQAGD